MALRNSPYNYNKLLVELGGFFADTGFNGALECGQN